MIYNIQKHKFNDKLKCDVHKPQYEQVSIYDKQEYVPWKSISSYGNDKVLVKILDSDATFTVDHVKYRTSSGIEITPFTYQGQEDIRMLMLNGKADTETEGIEAYITYKNANDTTENEKEIVIGKLNTLSLDKLKINLVIVPVNRSAGFSETEFTKALNEIYQQSVVEWNVTVEDVYNINQDDWDEDEDGKMNDGESTLLSNYSDEQLKLKRQYKSDRDIDKDAYYVFVMSDIPSKTGLAGYMPLKEQYAFIHSANSTNAAQLIAHELGHGAFRLWHTFSSESDYYMTEKSSDNLMDYNNGEELHKYQWNKIHNPDGGFYMFQDEEEGAMIDDKIIENILSGIRNVVNKNGNELKISDYYKTTYSYGVNVSKWKVVDFGDGNKFTVALYINKVSDELNKNIVKLLDKSEEITHRKYLSVDGNCLNMHFKYKERDDINGLEIAVPENESKKFKEYLFPTFIQRFKTSSDQAIKDALKSADGKTAPAMCNIGTRAVFYYMTGDPILFPKTCSCLDAFWCDEDQRLCGGIEGDQGEIGNANTMAVSLESGLEGFTVINDVSGHDYPDFAKMQEEVNNGAIIIGAQFADEGNGHICMLLPESLDQTDVDAGDIIKYVYINKVKTILPVALECGSDFKKVRRLVWSTTTLKNVKWYKYIK